MVIIKSPNSKYTGVSATVPFINGEGKTDNAELIEWFKSKGYEVIETESKTEDEKAILKAKAETLGIKVLSQWGITKLKDVITDKEAELAKAEPVIESADKAE